MKKRPFFSVIVNNYNYGRYLKDAVDSVFRQTFTDYEIILVDDGSADDSRKIAEKLSAKNESVICVFKENGGQASAFNAGFEASSGEYICFLDSDDMYFPEKLEETAKLHKSGCEYIYTDHQGINEDGSKCSDSLKRFVYSGWNMFPAYYGYAYPGSITSTLSVSRRLAEKIFPVENQNDWRIQADDTVVIQSVFMSRTCFLDQKLIYYRLHGGNGYYGREKSPDFTLSLMKNRNQLKARIMSILGMDTTFFHDTACLTAEFAAHDIIDDNLLKIYRDILWNEIPAALNDKIKADRELKSILKESLS